MGPLPATKPFKFQLDRASNADELARVANRELEDVPTDDDNVDTSAGERPSVDLTGKADPNLAAEREAHDRAAAEHNWATARLDMQQEEGEHHIFPTVPHEILRGKVRTSRTPHHGGKHRPVLENTEAAAAFDQAAAGKWSAEIGAAQLQNDAARSEKEAGEQAAHDEADARIRQLEENTKKDQLATRGVAQSEVAGARGAWQADIAEAERVYGVKSADARREYGGKIDAKKVEADGEARKKLDAAEKEAEEKREQAHRDAERAKKEKKEESHGFLGWLKDAVSDLIDAIKEAVNAIFDALRKIVKGIIEAAKAAACWIIDQARDFIIGMIELWGKAMELAADVFLAAFPEARAKAKKYIRKAVKTAEDGVNAAADALKQGVCAALDALGAALDFVLELYQKAFNAILDAIEFVIVGLIEIIEGIGRLASSATMIGDFFIGEALEEGVGFDPTRPLPIEKLKPSSGPSGSGALATQAQAAVRAGALAPGDAALLIKPRLDQTDVQVDQIARLSATPELLTSLPDLAEGEEFHFGQASDPEKRRQAILAGALAGTLPGSTGAASDAAAGVAGARPVAANDAAPASAPDTAAQDGERTPAQQKEIDEQLQHLEDETTVQDCNPKKEEGPADSGAVPDNMRTYGPFHPGERFRYMRSQMKKGITHWWDCNWKKILAVLAVGALVALLLGVLTGGAIFAAIPPLMEIISTIFIGVAIGRATIYVGDYIKLAWGGDESGGAKSLARGFAILLIELIFALIFNIRAVFKVLKSGLKGTVKAATAAAKNVVETTGKAFVRLGETSVEAAKAGLKNSKLIVKGFKSSFGEGIKTVSELTVELLSKTHFSGFFFKLRGRWLELWGKFNPPVKLGEIDLGSAEGQSLAKRLKLSVAKANQYLAAIARAGEKLSPEARANAESLAKAVGKAVQEGGELSKSLRARVRRFFRGFSSQHLNDNPLLGAVWERALAKVSKQPRFAKYFKAGVEAPEQVMKDLYAATRGEMDQALKSVVEDLEAEFGEQLAERLTELPQQVQVHHLVYKSIAPELAVAKENLVLALRKSGGAADELHDLFHLVSAGATGNRWRTLQSEVRSLLEDLYKL